MTFIRTKSGLYVHAIHGVNYVTLVTQKEFALTFGDRVYTFLPVIEELVGLPCEVYVETSRVKNG